MSLVGEVMCADGSTALEELRKHYEWIDKQNEVSKEESMSASAHVFEVKLATGGLL